MEPNKTSFVTHKFAGIKHFTKDEINFVTHVVLIWLDQTRGGDRTVTVPDCLIKARGKEAAYIVNSERKFHLNEWLRKFLYKLRQEGALTPQRYATIYPDVSINHIIEAERLKFFPQDSSMNSGHGLKVVDVRSLNSMEEMDIMLEPEPDPSLIMLEPEPDPSLNMAEMYFMLPDHPSIASIDPATYYDCDIENSFPKEYPRKSFTKDEMCFIDHVVSIWVHQRRRGDQRVLVTDRVIKKRAKEAACIINNECKFQCKQWLREFKADRRLEASHVLDTYLKDYPYKSMYDIIEEEWWNIFGDNSMKANDTRTINSPQVDEAELKTLTSVDTIQSYSEVLDCLKLLGSYAIDMRNMDAVQLVAQMEEFLQNEFS